ncbi:hypothetical protein [Flavobacterium gawalongense]|uniref:Nicotinate-nucleotide adenylyltransferase n=1 Tax=Flavobacterium gawalongense TaxID=2594432 RepID=A0A553BQP1_9FLAO|nr:hypothetical protein [Flavobacterium gawalongense]TRW99779.1 hypothetical protein FNW33_14530 [Flavobacterium gawalongense]TRX04085.1 hypothetical protein FNW12_14280 [Flavobacterium gawalongense]TRX10570.1 hypothetical protein FNW11_07555 [Flavobacterium gawalongense]TRX11719.1 hypothetical protein FNW10_06250 [Flavobacterium gawalongense]TRX29511.1 hypothetical protein FNW38_06345 [Flavobacterium gawalongense]
MKSLIIILLFLGLAVPSYSQDEGKMKIEELPGVVIKSAGKDFSVYLPDNNPDQTVRAVEEKFIAYDLGKDNEGFEEYLLVMSTKKGTLSATYDENGKLIRVVEEYKNVRLPSEVIYSIYRTYPGWAIVNDQFLYTQSEGDVIKKQYNVKIKKDNETVKLVVRPDGEIIKSK